MVHPRTKNTHTRVISKFESVWSSIETHARTIIRKVVREGYVDDVMSELSVEVWETLQEQRKFNDTEHMHRYFLRIARFRAISFKRRELRYLQMQADVHINTTERVYNFDPATDMDHKELLSVLESTRGRYRECDTVFNIINGGLSYRTIREQMGISITTINRDVTLFMKRFRCGMRYNSDNIQEQPLTKGEGEGHMTATKKTATKKKVAAPKSGDAKKKKSVNHSTASAATIAAVEDLNSIMKLQPPIPVEGMTDEQLLAEIKDVAGDISPKDKLADGTVKFLTDNNIEFATKETETTITTTTGAATTTKAKKKAAEPKSGVMAAVAKKKKAAVSKPDLPSKKALDLSKLKDVPATLEAWQVLVGGNGYCLGGSGQAVIRRFRPGYDAKLKSCLKKLGTANAKKLAKALGWQEMIKW